MCLPLSFLPMCAITRAAMAVAAAATAAMSPSLSEEAGFPIAVDQSEGATAGGDQRRIAGRMAVGGKRERGREGDRNHFVEASW